MQLINFSNVYFTSINLLLEVKTKDSPHCGEVMISLTKI